MQAFKLGDKVKWVSQAQGCAVKKVGHVVEVVAPGTYATKLHNCGFRKGESYLVEVPGKTSKAQPKLYWPVVSLLKGAAAGEKEGRSW